ncbi:DUF2283 domain-containing protein [Promicromonospora sp. CA-289599]|uniref:DUF2283 domain-containing protein n=1 Tax=Promicromonospora sp. CA-289599 TaxID=3240014 RepID=UPI003D922988
MQTSIRVDIDSEADAAYVTLSDKPVAESAQLKGGVVVDLDDMGVAVGIEFLDLGAPIDYDVLTTRFHVHSEVIDLLKTIRPSVGGWVATITSAPDTTTSPDQTLVSA